MDTQKLQSLLNREEGPKLDFKKQLNIDTGSGKKELAKDVSAIANSRGGRGYIIFGVEDKTKRIIGINPEDFKEEKIQQVISTRCEPPIPISIEIVEYLGKHIAVIVIYSGEQKPYQLREVGSFYIRRGSTTDIMRKEELASLLQESGLLNYELTPVTRAGLGALNMERVKEYTKRTGIFVDDSNTAILESLGIIVRDKESGEYHPTSGGLLLFGHNPQLYMPHCCIRVVNKINPGYDQVRTFSGPIFGMIDDVEIYLKNIVNKDSYPLSAVYEAISNAVAYRDYFDIYNEILVLLLKNSIQVISPGSLIKDSSNKLYGVNIPARRNMWLYQRLITIDTKNRFSQSGRGFKRMRKAFSGHGRIKLLNLQDKNVFKVIFPGVEAFN